MKLPLEMLRVETMASGDRSLVLTEAIEWDAFPEYADAILRALGGTVDSRADGPDQRVWTVTIEGQPFWLTYEDYPRGVSLDSRTSDASALILRIREHLIARRESL